MRSLFELLCIHTLAASSKEYDDGYYTSFPPPQHALRLSQDTTGYERPAVNRGKLQNSCHVIHLARWLCSRRVWRHRFSKHKIHCVIVAEAIQISLNCTSSRGLHLSSTADPSLESWNCPGPLYLQVVCKARRCGLLPLPTAPRRCAI